MTDGPERAKAGQATWTHVQSLRTYAGAGKGDEAELIFSPDIAGKCVMVSCSL